MKFAKASTMLKLISLPMILVLASVGMGSPRHQDKSVHHAAMHAEHWVSGRTNAPHRRFRKKYRHKKGHDRSTHHAAVHAENWISHHINAPHH